MKFKKIIFLMTILQVSTILHASMEPQITNAKNNLLAAQTKLLNLLPAPASNSTGSGTTPSQNPATPSTGSTGGTTPTTGATAPNLTPQQINVRNQAITDKLFAQVTTFTQATTNARALAINDAFATYKIATDPFAAATTNARALAINDAFAMQTSA